MCLCADHGCSSGGFGAGACHPNGAAQGCNTLTYCRIRPSACSLHHHHKCRTIFGLHTAGCGSQSIAKAAVARRLGSRLLHVTLSSTAPSPRPNAPTAQVPNTRTKYGRGAQHCQTKYIPHKTNAHMHGSSSLAIIMLFPTTRTTFPGNSQNAPRTTAFGSYT